MIALISDYVEEGLDDLIMNDNAGFTVSIPVYIIDHDDAFKIST